MQRLWSVIIGYSIIALCCISQPASESKAENRGFPKGVIVGVDSATVASPRTESIRLAKSDKRGETQGEHVWNRLRKREVSEGDEPTKVKINGNSVFVPVAIVCGSKKVDVHLLLDTGATGTAIHTEIADQLLINLSKAREAQVQVVGGTVIKVRVVRIDSLIVGPHIIRNGDIFVIPHENSAARGDGLLGMDVIRGLKYKVDFKKQVIIWE